MTKRTGGHTRDRKRAHVIVPEEILREVDALVGPRRRSEFFVAAAQEKLDRERLRAVAHELMGSLRDRDIPCWETPEAASSWVHALRRENDETAFHYEPK